MKTNLISIVVSLIVIISYSVNSIIQPPLVVFSNVGQGDGMIFSYKNTQVIVDGGPGNYLENTIGKYIPFYDREIELMVLTHAHLDHYAGLADILKTFKVKRIVIPKEPCKLDPIYWEFLKLVESEGAIVESISEVIFGDLKIRFIYQPKESCPNSSMEVNNSSVVTTFEYGGIKILNMGDLEYQKEDEIEVVGVDILKAGHHCSKTSSSDRFIKRITPSVAICSLGENSYGHPAKAILKRFKENNVEVYITYEYGDILVNLKEGLIYNQKGKLLRKL